MAKGNTSFDTSEIWALASYQLSNMKQYSYYIPAHGFAYNPVKDGIHIGSAMEEDVAAFLYAVYMKYSPIDQNQPAYHDGVSITTYKDGTVNVRIVLNNRVFDIPDRPYT